MPRFVRCDSCKAEEVSGHVQGWAELGFCLLNEDGEEEGSIDDGPMLCAKCLRLAKEAVAEKLGLDPEMVSL